MPELGQNLKEFVMKGIDAIGNTASSLASTTRNKVNEMALKGRRSEILACFGEKAYEAWKNGAELPEELVPELKEVMELDAELGRMKDADEDPEENGEPEIKEDREKLPQTDIPVIQMPEKEENAPKDIPLSDAIDHLFSDTPKMDQMADKINSSLDEMGKQLLQFSSDFGKKISDMADELMNDDDQKN